MANSRSHRVPPGPGHWRTRVYNSDVLRTRASMKTLQKNPRGLFTTSKSLSPVRARLETQTKNLSLSSEMLGGFLENCCFFSARWGGTFKFPPRAGFASIEKHFRAPLFVGFSVQVEKGMARNSSQCGCSENTFIPKTRILSIPYHIPHT